MQTNSTTTSNLPRPVAGYFADHTNDAEALAACFAHDAVVFDEGREHRGRAAIAAWNAAANARFAFTTEVVAAETNGARTTVLARVTGGFPGSPVVLRFHFDLAGELISRLEITP